MKRIMALAAAMSMLAMFALASHAAAQSGPTVSVDPEYVSEAGDHEVTVSGSDWQADPAITQCPGFGGVLPPTLDEAAAFANCPNLVASMSALVPAPGGSFTTSMTVSVPADGLVLLAFTADPSAFAMTAIKVGEPMDDMDDGDMDDMDGDMGDGDMDDMGDDMAPMGGADTGFGGTAGSDSSGIAVPLAATLAAVTLLGGAALVARRNT